MANQRAKDQQLLPFAAKRQFVSELDAGLEKIGCGNRSQFIRDAILEKLAREKVHIPRHLAAAPGRTQSPPPESFAKKSNSNVVAGADSIEDEAKKEILAKRKKPAPQKVSP